MKNVKLGQTWTSRDASGDGMEGRWLSVWKDELLTENIVNTTTAITRYNFVVHTSDRE